MKILLFLIFVLLGVWLWPPGFFEQTLVTLTMGEALKMIAACGSWYIAASFT